MSCHTPVLWTADTGAEPTRLPSMRRTNCGSPCHWSPVTCSTRLFVPEGLGVGVGGGVVGVGVGVGVGDGELLANPKFPAVSWPVVTLSRNRACPSLRSTTTLGPAWLI